MLTKWLHRFRTWRRRRKLLNAYARVYRVRYDLGPGFTALMLAYDALERDGLATVTEAGLDWHWPESATGGRS